VARSSLILVLLAGCDSVFGLVDDPKPCQPASFDGMTPTTLAVADEFSVDWDQRFAVISMDGLMYEMELPAGELVAIDLGVYMDLGLSLSPEGDALFYTAQIEPVLLRGALRTAAARWTLDATVPRGSYAGTPSGDAFGPRHVLVRLRTNDADVIEYEDRDGVWMPVGDLHPVPGQRAPNLSPNGLVMVYAAQDALGEHAIYAATRASRDEWFGNPQKILTGEYSQPQLLGKCHNLYVDDGALLQRFDR